MAGYRIDWWCVVLLIVVVLFLPPVVGEDCPRLPSKSNHSFPHPLNVRGSEFLNKSEFLCDFNWTDTEHMKDKLLDRLAQRQKTFVRFTVPVLGYNNPYLSMSNYSGYLTWVWVLDSHEYMLYYPQNFIVISTLTMGIITQDWAIDYTNKTPVSLEGFGLDLDWFDTDDIVGYCDPQCVAANQSCGIGKYELEKFLMTVTEGKDKYKWNWLCLQSPYDAVQDIVSVPHFARPDLLYYWKFLTMFFAKRPWPGFMQRKTDFPQYYCYNKQDKCELKELLKHFWVVPAIGLLLWLLSPLLIHYFPSSSPKKVNVPKNMFPSYKTPVYFGRCLKCMLCFYTQKGMPGTQRLIYIRRLLFLLVLAITGIRLFFHYPYISFPLFACAAVAIYFPTYFSEHITAKLPTQFLFWDLPPGLTRGGENLIEYQQLAHVMQERIYLTVDLRFWGFVYEKSFQPLHLLLQWQPGSACAYYLTILVLGPFALLFSTLLLLVALLWNFMYYFIPLPYFYLALMRAILAGESQYISSAWRLSSPFWIMLKVVAACFHGSVMVCLILYTFIVTFTWCYAISEFTMFTFIGGALTASMGFQYFVLVGAFATTTYTLVRDLHEGYDRILDEIIKILKEKGTFTKLASEVSSKSNGDVILELDKSPNNESEFSITVRKTNQAVPHSKLLVHDGITTYVNKDLYDTTVESCRPLRRQILFIIVKLIAMLFYSFIAFWVKNVYHLEDKVAVIFKVVQTVALYFLQVLFSSLVIKAILGRKRILF